MSVAMKQPFVTSLLSAVISTECWRWGSSKYSPGRHHFGTSQITYARIAFCSWETGKPTYFGSIWGAYDFPETWELSQPSLEDGGLVHWKTVF